jgi:hypothetical protein
VSGVVCRLSPSAARCCSEAPSKENCRIAVVKNQSVLWRDEIVELEREDFMTARCINVYGYRGDLGPGGYTAWFSKEVVGQNHTQQQDGVAKLLSMGLTYSDEPGTNDSFGGSTWDDPWTADLIFDPVKWPTQKSVLFSDTMMPILAQRTIDRCGKSGTDEVFYDTWWPNELNDPSGWWRNHYHYYLPKFFAVLRSMKPDIKISGQFSALYNLGELIMFCRDQKISLNYYQQVDATADWYVTSKEHAEALARCLLPNTIQSFEWQLKFSDAGQVADLIKFAKENLRSGQLLRLVNKDLAEPDQVPDYGYLAALDSALFGVASQINQRVQGVRPSER